MGVHPEALEGMSVKAFALILRVLQHDSTLCFSYKKIGLSIFMAMR